MSPASADHIRSSIKVTLIATIVSGLVQATIVVTLARLLEPQDYGFYVVCLSINALTISFLMTGIERAMVIEPDEAMLARRSQPLVLALLLIGTITVGLCAAIRHATGWAIDIRVLAIMLVAQALSAFATTPRALLRKHLRFGRIVTGEVAGLVLGNLLTASLLANLGLGVFSLMGGFVVGLATSTLWVLAGSPGSMAGFNIAGLSSLARTAAGVFKPASVEALNGQISPLIVSSVLGPVSLGLFNRVYNIVTLPVQLMISSLNRVMISALVSVSDDLERQRQGTNLMLRMAMALITPLTFGVAGSSYAFVATVLGPKWTSAAPIIPFLALAVWGNMIGALLGQLAESVQRFNDKTRVQAIATAVLVVALLVGSIVGITGVAIGMMVAGLVLAGLYVQLTAEILEVRSATIGRWLMPGWIAGFACAITANGVGYLLAHWAPPSILIAQVAACGGATVATYAAVDQALLREFSRTVLPHRLDQIVQRMLPGRTPRPAA